MYIPKKLTLLICCVMGIVTGHEAGKWTEFSFIVKPSPLGGIGVFATHDIPAGTHILRNGYDRRTLQIKDIPEEFRTYCIKISDEECVGPQQFDRMEIGWYINHSATPNIAQKTVIIENEEECIIYACTDIKVGDEILINYNDLNEPEHLKEDYYK